MPYDNTNHGVLFKNNKPKNEKSPGYTGSINVGGKDYFLNAWLKESDKAGKFFSLSVKEKNGAAKSETTPDPDDEIPF